MLLTDLRDGVLRLTLNRPEVLNSVNAQLARALQEALARAGTDTSVRAVLLTGAGRAFCAGQDLAEAIGEGGEPSPDLDEFVRNSWNPTILALRTIEKPVVCAVNGAAAGAGANLALACDIVFAADEASFIQSFAKIGLIPDSGGTFILPRIVGLQRATVLTMLAEKLSAAEAREFGLVYRVVPSGSLIAEAEACARQLATQPTRALGMIKRAFNHSLGVSLEAQLGYETDLQREAGGTADYAEGVRAFLEKRKPEFTGR